MTQPDEFESSSTSPPDRPRPLIDWPDAFEKSLVYHVVAGDVLKGFPDLIDAQLFGGEDPQRHTTAPIQTIVQTALDYFRKHHTSPGSQITDLIRALRHHKDVIPAIEDEWAVIVNAEHEPYEEIKTHLGARCVHRATRQVLLAQSEIIARGAYETNEEREALLAPGKERLQRIEAAAQIGGAEHLKTVNLEAVTAEQVDWIERGRSAWGQLTVLYGDPETCKTTMGLQRIAWHTRQGQRCVILSLEDNAATVIKPRIVAAGGDPKLVTIVKSTRDGRQVDLAQDLRHLRALIHETGAKYLMVSPINAYLGRANTWKDSEVRVVVDPLMDMAADLRITGHLIGHPNKNTAQKALYRMSGANALINAARISLVTGLDPQDPARLVLVSVKNSLGEAMLPAAFRKVIKTVTVDGQEMQAVTLEWEPEPLDARLYTADYLLGAKPDAKPDPALDEAKTFLVEILGDKGREVRGSVIEAARENAMIAQRTLERARRDLKVTHRQATKAEVDAEQATQGERWFRLEPRHHPDRKVQMLEAMKKFSARHESPITEDGGEGPGDAI